MHIKDFIVQYWGKFIATFRAVKCALNLHKFNSRVTHHNRILHAPKDKLAYGWQFTVRDICQHCKVKRVREVRVLF